MQLTPLASDNGRQGGYARAAQAHTAWLSTSPATRGPGSRPAAAALQRQPEQGWGRPSLGKGGGTLATCASMGCRGWVLVTFWMRYLSCLSFCNLGASR